MNEVTALDGRVTRLETQIAEGLKRIESLLRSEINGLKTDQIKDLREANARLADDQRRLWEAMRAMEMRESQRIGAGKALTGISHFFSAGLGGFVTWLMTWLSQAKPPH